MISTKVGELAALREGEPDERKMKAGEGRIRGRRLRVRLPDVVVVDVKVRSVGRRTHLGNVRRGLVGHRFPVDADKPGKSLFFVSIIFSYAIEAIIVYSPKTTLVNYWN